MKILVYPHTMEVGGSQLNAIELAAAVRDLGHEVAVISDNGPLVAKVEELGLERVPIPTKLIQPSPVVARHIRGLVRKHNIDIVHGYEWPPALEAAAGTYQLPNTVTVATIMSMSVAPFLPASMPIAVSTRAIQQYAAARRPGPVYYLGIPVDVDYNHPSHPADEFRARYLPEHAFPGGEPIVNIGVICRLVPELKLEGVLTAIDVIGELAQRRAVRLFVVGDGSARDAVRERAARANERAGWQAVVLTGQLDDPRPAYAAADIMLGMGGSALRALCFGKPLVVQGERGFWKLLTPQTKETFLFQGWYGVGDAEQEATARSRLTQILLGLVDDPAARGSLGAFGRQLAVDDFSLQQLAKIQLEIYQTALADPWSTTGRGAIEGARAFAGLTSYKLRRRYQRLRGTAKRDDFNDASLALRAIQQP
jgi:glycosyltransferase involved in cell wall biosynthesis